MKHALSFYATAPKNPKRAFRIHLLVFLVLTPLTWIIWSWTNSSYPWPIWSTPAWALGVLFHYLGVFAFTKK